MGSLYKQKGSENWWMKYYVNGRPKRETTSTADKAEADRILKRTEGKIADGHRVLDGRTKYEEAADDLRQYYRTTRTRDIAEAGFRLKRLDTFFAGKLISRIGPADVRDYVEKRRKEGTADKTINNEIEVLIKMLRVAYENEKLPRLPIIHKLKVNNVRTGFFEREMYEKVRRFLAPDYQVVIAIEYAYGWRTQSEVLKLEWRMVDFQTGTLRLDPGMTKNDDGRIVYMTAEVQRLLKEHMVRVAALEMGMKKIIPYVFPHLTGNHRGERIKDFKKAWKTACQKAGYPGMYRHDFRRTSVRNMERAGVPRSVAMKVTGHRSEAVYIRYAITNDEQLKDATNRIAGIDSGIVEENPTMPEALSD